MVRLPYTRDPVHLTQPTRKYFQHGLEIQLRAWGYAERDVLWNTKPIQASLALIDSMGDDVLEEDLARLSPLKWGHINMFGEVLHPLRDPSAFLGLELEL